MLKRKLLQRPKLFYIIIGGGYPGYINEINKIGKEKGIFVVEDASEAFGSEYYGEKLGNTNTDIVCYSFTPVRLPNAIDGGGLAFNNKDLFEKAKKMRDYGIDRSKFRDKLGEISDQCDIKMPGNACAMKALNQPN